MSLPPLFLTVAKLVFYDGLALECQYMINNAVGGTMGEKTTEETVELYEMLGPNSQQKSARGKRVGVNEVQGNNGMGAQLIELT